MKQISIKATLILAGIIIISSIFISSLINSKYVHKSFTKLINSQEYIYKLHANTYKLIIMSSEILRISLNSTILENKDILISLPRKSNEFYKICDEILLQLPNNQTKLIDQILIIKDEYKELLLKVLAISGQFTEELNHSQNKLIETNKFVESFLNRLNIFEKSIDKFSKEKNKNISENTFTLIDKLKLFVLLFIIIVIATVLIVLKKKLYTPLYNLLDFSRSINVSEDYLSKRIDYSSNDEIGILSKSLNEMLEKLQKSTIDKTRLQNDIKKRVLLEEKLNFEKNEAKNANRTKSEFLANMSHEIRTPLNAIMGFIKLLRDSEINKQKIKYLDIINDSSKDLINIINDILDISKIESGQLHIEHLAFNPASELEVIARLFQAKMQEKNIQMHINIEELPNSLNGDITRIKQVIKNLLSNAVKFTNENKNIYLKIRYEDSFLHVSVKDEGIGISKEYQNTIFDAFTQEDSSTTRKYGGTGLGLSISYNLVNIMDGELKVISALREGSEFYFAIPLEIGQEIKEEESTIPMQRLKGHVLLVEDNKANQMFMNIVLEEIGLSVDIASDGYEAIKAFKDCRYNVILMDENMPNMNGMEATKEILEYENKNDLVHTPVIALTANALKGDREKFLKAGMDEYITKPVEVDSLTKILSSFL